MAPTLEGQVEVNGLLMGPSTPYVVSEFNPWARTVRATQGGPRAWNHGNWSGAEWLDEAVVSIRIYVDGATRAEFANRMHALRAAFEPIGAEVVDRELRFIRGGVEYLMLGRPRSVEPEILRGQFAARSSCAFVCPDARMYSAVEFNQNTGLPAFSGGTTVPLTLPFTVDGVLTSGTLQIVNGGLAPTPLRLRIDGPTERPRVTVLGPDAVVNVLQVNFDLDPGQWLDIDTAAHSVLLNGVANRRGEVDGTFPLLLPGTSTVRFNASRNDTGALLTVRWRSAW